ncbi:helix-turn-helix transcriptional regulator [Planomonospora corallina]|uniref:Helix-turn-helix transcriptional regulator n=1 Tax=Planomonospora corallina TaxID=1806052 RepID=A0ABV8IFT3_9ACTN
MPPPRERMLRLLSLLQTGRRWPAGELASAVDATPRTLRRDIEHLRDLGYPVESARGPGGHYRLVAGAALPPLMLEDDEAIAAVLGLKLAAAGGAGLDFATEAAERAAAKLRRILPAPLRRRTDEILTAVEIGATGHPQPSPALLGEFAAAIAAHRRVVFGHAGERGPSRRTVEPHRLVRLRKRWYLFAWDLDRHDWRAFRLDRIDGPRTTDDVFRPRALPADDLAAHLRDRFRGPAAHQVVLTLHADARDAAARLHRVDGTLHPVDDRRCRYIADVDSYEWLATVLVLAGLEFTVDRPDAFGEYLARAAHRLLRATGRGPAVDTP